MLIYNQNHIKCVILLFICLKFKKFYAVNLNGGRRHLVSNRSKRSIHGKPNPNAAVETEVRSNYKVVILVNKISLQINCSTFGLRFPYTNSSNIQSFTMTHSFAPSCRFYEKVSWIRKGCRESRDKESWISRIFSGICWKHIIATA